MAEQTLKNNPDLTEKSGFTDTGSAKIVENQTISSEDTQFSSENTDFQGKTEENPIKSPPFSQNQIKNGENPTALEEKPPKTVETSSVASNSAHNLFDESNISAFSKDFPGVNLENLRNSKDFQTLLGVLTANPTLSRVYQCFNEISSSIEAAARQQMAQSLANASASVGSLASSEGNKELFFTKDQVLHMSSAQIKENYDIIRKSQEHW